MKKKREKSLERFFFSRVVSFVLIGLFLVFNSISFLSEWLIAGTDWRWSLVLRGSTIILDSVFILTWFNKARTHSTNKLKEKKLDKKRLFIWLLIADTVWIIVFIFSFYVLKLFVLFQLDKINKRTFIINFWLGLITAILLGAILKLLIDHIKNKVWKWVKLKWQEKWRKRNEYQKKK